MLQISIFTDCVDDNARHRQISRYESLFPGVVIDFNGLSDGSISTLAGIVDILDASRFGKIPHIVICNVAPRAEKKYPNGRPFCFTRIGNAIVIGTEGSFTFLKKLGIVQGVQVTDILTVCKKFLDAGEAERIASSQFRSFDYVPLLALWLFENKDIPNEVAVLESQKITEQVWFRDCFGNCKTTLTEEVLKNSIVDGHVSFRLGEKSDILRLPFYTHLSEVPNDTTALIIGSSGYANSRFVEIVKQGSSAGDELNLAVGTQIFLQ